MLRALRFFSKKVLCLMRTLCFLMMEIFGRPGDGGSGGVEV